MQVFGFYAGQGSRNPLHLSSGPVIDARDRATQNHSLRGKSCTVLNTADANWRQQMPVSTLTTMTSHRPGSPGASLATAGP